MQWCDLVLFVILGFERGRHNLSNLDAEFGVDIVHIFL